MLKHAFIELPFQLSETYGLTIRPTPATRIDNVQLTTGRSLEHGGIFNTAWVYYTNY